MNDTGVAIAKIEGRLDLISSELKNTNNNLKKTNKLLNSFNGKLNDFVTRDEFNSYTKEVDPIIEWGRSRIAIERFLYGVIGLLGVSQIATAVVVFMKILTTT